MIKQARILTVVGYFLATGVSLAQDTSPFKLVVNSSSPVSSLTTARVSQLFLKKVTRWSHGTKVLPVDQLEKSPVRAAFSEQVHGRNVGAIKSYWQTQLFGGRATPPPELASDDEVLSYVRANAGAIGYVSKGAVVGDGVRVVAVTG